METRFERDRWTTRRSRTRCHYGKRRKMHVTYNRAMSFFGEKNYSPCDHIDPLLLTATVLYLAVSFRTVFPLKRNWSASERMLLFSLGLQWEWAWRERIELDLELWFQGGERKIHSAFGVGVKRWHDCLSYEELTLGYVHVINCNQLTPIMRRTLALYS